MSGRAVFRRDEFVNAALDFGATSIDLAEYGTTGLRVVAVGPSGIGKTNCGLLIAEQLAAQGWVCVLMDPEGEIEALYGEAVPDAEDLGVALETRLQQMLVVRVRTAAEFLPYAETIMAAVDAHRKPVFLMLDESQIFSTARRGKKDDDQIAASEFVNDFVQRGRKRALDLFLSAHRFSGSLHRSVFSNKNLTLIGRQEDPTTWSALAPQFKGSGIGFPELQALAPGEFFCFSRRGVERVVMPMADALRAEAPAASIVRPSLPRTYTDWDRALRAMSPERLRALTQPVTTLLGAVAGLSMQQVAAGNRALRDELEARA